MQETSVDSYYTQFVVILESQVRSHEETSMLSIVVQAFIKDPS